MQLPRFPDPPRCAILSTQSLLHKCVIIKHLLHLWVTHTLLNFLLDYLQRPIHILQGHFLIQKLTQVLDRALKQKLLLGVLNLADQDFLHELQLLLCHSLLRVIDGLTVVLPHTLKIFTWNFAYQQRPNLLKVCLIFKPATNISLRGFLTQLFLHIFCLILYLP